MGTEIERKKRISKIKQTSNKNGDEMKSMLINTVGKVAPMLNHLCSTP
jgi:hypothetical protein